MDNSVENRRMSLSKQEGTTCRLCVYLSRELSSSEGVQFGDEGAMMNQEARLLELGV